MSTYPVVCTHCNRSLCGIYEEYKKLVSVRMRELADSDGVIDNSILANFDIKMTTEDILDAMNIKKECCRGTVMTRIVGYQN